MCRGCSVVFSFPFLFFFFLNLETKNLNLETQTAPLALPQLDRLYEASFARDESYASNAGVAAIPTQFKVTQEVLQK
jgi:hypothetical protein